MPSRRSPSILLGFDLFVGLTTYLRLVETTREDLRSVQGMNRIRHAYLEMVPGLAPYFVSSDRDDLAGILMTYEGPSREDMMAGRPGMSGMLHGFSTNTGMIAVVVSLVGASFAGVAVAQVGDTMAPVVGDRCGRLLRAARGPASDRHRLDVHLLVATVAHFPSDVAEPSVAGGERRRGLGRPGSTRRPTRRRRSAADGPLSGVGPADGDRRHRAGRPRSPTATT